MIQTTFGGLIRHRPHLRRLWLSTIVSLLGDWLSYVAISLLTIKRGESALAVGLVLVAHALPVALLSPAAGALADRFDRRRVLMLAYLGAGGLTVAMWQAAGHASIWVIHVLLFLRVAVSSLGMTARTALIPSVVEPEEMHLANSFLGLTWSVMFAAGVALGGLLADVVGPVDAIAFDALTFLIATAIVAGLPAFPPKKGDRLPTPGFAEIVFAWRLIKPDPHLLVTLLSKAPLALATSATWVSLTLLAERRMDLVSVAAGLGWMHMVRGVGTGVGPLLPARWIRREANRASPLVFLGITLFLAFSHPIIFFPALLLWGMGTGHNWVSATATLQTRVPDQALGRVTSLDFLSFSTAQIIGAIGSGLLIDWWGDPTVGGWVGCGLGLLAWSALWRIQRRADRAARAATSADRSSS